MTTSLGNALRNVAVNLLDSLGASAQIRRTERAVDSSSSKIVITGTTTYNVKISPPAPKIISNYEGVRITGDMTTLLAAQGLALVPSVSKDQLIFDNKTWDITEVTPIYGDELVVAYELTLK